MPVKIKLKQLREDKGLSQNALARQLEMSLANIQKIEYGKAKSIPLDTLEKICLALDCEIGDLLVIVKPPLSQDE
ncbi:helix-turn-helix domain-containing protein [Pelatocladus sp. BLCC-F211]|uniref:helix-turn-helix domain-containing protein n=1 Tax=Pelatocladus sp. BLCC-F211 TaxID=3342752 RepID=UPI0035B9BA81